MQRCLDLALLGAGSVAPNPMVGCVIVYEDRIIGEGFHQKYGEAHAEVNAIKNVKPQDKHLLSQSTLYVNLEPCAHFGKTPPCANLIIEHQIKRVVIGMLDPNPLVAGKGAALLKNAGIEVTSPILKEACEAFNKRFIKGITQQKPYVILKWAQTMNGYLSPDASKISAAQFEQERHITGKWVQKLVHKWRTTEDAVMVATNTALTDNPALNNRAWEGRSPARIVLDKNLRLPSHLKLFDNSQTTFVLNAMREERIGNTIYLKLDFESDWFSQALSRLYEFHIGSIVVEGGSKLLHYLIEYHLWDEAIVFYSKSHLQEGIVAPSIKGRVIQQCDLEQVQMIQYLQA